MEEGVRERVVKDVGTGEGRGAREVWGGEEVRGTEKVDRVE